MENRRAVCGSHGAPAGAAGAGLGLERGWGRGDGSVRRAVEGGGGGLVGEMEGLAGRDEGERGSADDDDVIEERCEGGDSRCARGRGVALRGAVEHGDDGGWADEVAPRRRHRQCQGGGAGVGESAFAAVFGRMENGHEAADGQHWKMDGRQAGDDGKFFSDGLFFRS